MNLPDLRLPALALAPGSVEHWAAEFIMTDRLAGKLAPSPQPTRWMHPRPQPTRIDAPGRPPEFDLISKTRRSLRRQQLHNPRRRAQLIHTFLHHELQAAELMAWAILAFPDTPERFRSGLLAICQDELRHLQLYRGHLERLGYQVGDFPVRDWFWQRAKTCTTPLAFVALLGIGLEGCNLDHSRRFAAWFRAAGDTAGADVQVLVGDEEVGHVRFALEWFRQWSKGDDLFEAWRTALVEPLTPTMFRGPEIDVERRRQAGLPDEFIERLRGWEQP